MNKSSPTSICTIEHFSQMKHIPIIDCKERKKKINTSLHHLTLNWTYETPYQLITLKKY